MRIQLRQSRRAGNVLLLCALMLFVIFGVTALVIDLGVARMTQRQMDTATNSASREGLRYRDAIPEWLQQQIDDPNSEIATGMAHDGVDTTDHDQVRRWMAKYQVNLTYQDLPASTTDSGTQFGAGPLYQVGPDHKTDGYALQTITAPTGITAYKPQLQLNKGNAIAGDLVAGKFLSPGEFTANPEGADYSRVDFDPVAGVDSFLVRLRRTNDPRSNPTPWNSLDNIDGVSATGPALPLIFGQATLIPAADPNNRSYRRDGVVVRGTSIAQVRPVVAVGAPRDSVAAPPGIAGAASFFISLPAWQDATRTTYTIADVVFFTPPRSSGMILVGDKVAALAAPPAILPAATAHQDYVPLVDPASGLVAAFGFVTTDGKTLTKVTPRIAAENATASMAPFLANANDPTIPDPGNAAVMNRVRSLMSDPNRNLYLSAPALGR